MAKGAGERLRLTEVALRITMPNANKQNALVGVLALVSLIALIAAYFAPIWWVSLTAPNYPKDALANRPSRAARCCPGQCKIGRAHV